VNIVNSNNNSCQVHKVGSNSSIVAVSLDGRTERTDEKGKYLNGAQKVQTFYRVNGQDSCQCEIRTAHTLGGGASPTSSSSSVDESSSESAMCSCPLAFPLSRLEGDPAAAFRVFCHNFIRSLTGGKVEEPNEHSVLASRVFSFGFGAPIQHKVDYSELQNKSLTFRLIITKSEQNEL